MGRTDRNVFWLAFSLCLRLRNVCTCNEFGRIVPSKFCSSGPGIKYYGQILPSNRTLQTGHSASVDFLQVILRSIPSFYVSDVVLHPRVRSRADVFQYET